MSKTDIHEYIKTLLSELFTNVIDDWEYGKEPFRLVMISSVQCYYCKNIDESDNIYTRYTSDFNGFFNKYGWSFCKDCLPMINMAEYYYKESKNYLMYEQTQYLRDGNYKFYRISSSKKIAPYIQSNAKILRETGNSLIKSNERLYVPISWEYNNDIFQKMIKLSNILFFNRNYFINGTNIVDINNSWKKLVEKEEQYVTIWSIILGKLNRLNIPNGIIRKISEFWGVLI